MQKDVLGKRGSGAREAEKRGEAKRVGQEERMFTAPTLHFRVSSGESCSISPNPAQTLLLQQPSPSRPRELLVRGPGGQVSHTAGREGRHRLASASERLGHLFLDFVPGNHLLLDKVVRK